MGLSEKLTLYTSEDAPPAYEENAAPVTALEGKILARLRSIWTSNKLQAFYTDAQLTTLAKKLATIDFARMASERRFPHSDIAIDFVALALYDIVILGDDSGSMTYAVDETRVDDLRTIVKSIAQVAQLFDDDGIEVRWFNSDKELNNVTDGAAVDAFFAANAFGGTTPMGKKLQERVIEPMVLKKITKGRLAKPVLVFVITDGDPDSRTDVVDVIRGAKTAAKKSKYGEFAVAFAFAQVGKDVKAQKWLAEIDTHPDVGNSIDATSHYEMEQEEFKANGIDLTPHLWLMKLTLGAVDPALDAEDE